MLYYPSLVSMPSTSWQEHADTDVLYTFCEHDLFGPLFVAGLTSIKGVRQQQAIFLALYLATDEKKEDLVARAQEYVAPAHLREATEEVDRELLANPVLYGGALNAMIITHGKMTFSLSMATGRIPFGTTLSYKELACSLGKPKAARAVGTALKNNHLALIIPCHRIIRSDGSVGEYRWGSEKKKLLIEWEQAMLAQREAEQQAQANMQATKNNNIAQG